MNSYFPRIAPEGFWIIILFLFAGGLTALLNYQYVSIILLLFAAFNLFFFRDPVRETKHPENAVAAPADGKVVEVTETTEPHFFNYKMLKISIFLSVLDCHVNRFPLSGKVLSTTYRKGGFGLAFRPEASSGNERLATLIESQNGMKIVMVQITGFIARRIVSYADVGSNFRTGERFGIIRYGSRVDIFLPSDMVESSVSPGDRVTGGESVIAWVKEKEKR